MLTWNDLQSPWRNVQWFVCVCIVQLSPQHLVLWPAMTYNNLRWSLVIRVDLWWPILTYIDPDLHWPLATHADLCWPAMPPPPLRQALTLEGRECTPGLHPDTFTAMTLRNRQTIGDKMEMFNFVYPEPNKHSGCLSGQYVKVGLVLVTKPREWWETRSQEGDEAKKL